MKPYHMVGLFYWIIILVQPDLLLKKRLESLNNQAFIINLAHRKIRRTQ